MNNQIIKKKNNIKEAQELLSETYYNVIKKYYQNNDELTYENIISFLRKNRKTKSNATLAIYKAALKKLIKQSVKDITQKAIIDQAFSEIKIHKQDKAITKEKIISKDTVKEMMSLSNKKNELIIHTLYSTGLRVSELINIKLKDCKILNEDGIKYISVSIVGKGNKERKIKLNLSLYEKIKKVFSSKEYLFETKNNKPFNRQAIYRIINRAGEKALGTKQVHPHTLRHSFATELLVKENKSLKAVSKYLGHSSTAITSDFYIHDELSIKDLMKL